MDVATILDNLSNDDYNVLIDFEDEVMKLYNVMRGCIGEVIRVTSHVYLMMGRLWARQAAWGQHMVMVTWS